MDIDLEWDDFLENDENFSNNYTNTTTNNTNNLSNEKIDNNISDKCSKLYISTKTKIVYIDREIDIYDIFWKIPLIKYHEQTDGILKKQIKLSLLSQEESSNFQKKINNINDYIINKSLSFVDDNNSRIKYKDIRKISIGLSKKDLLYNKVKDKSAFYNCFVLTIRIFNIDILNQS